MKTVLMFILVALCILVGPVGNSYENENSRHSHLIIEVYHTNVKECIRMRSAKVLTLMQEYNSKSVGQFWSRHISRSHLCLIVFATILLCFTVYQTLGIDQLASGIVEATLDVKGEGNNIKGIVREMNEFQSNYSHLNLKLLKMVREINKLGSEMGKEETAVNVLGLNLNCWSKSWNRRTTKLIQMDPEEWKHALEGFETGIKKRIREETDDLETFVRKTEPIVAHGKWIANLYDSHMQYVDHQVREKRS